MSGKRKYQASKSTSNKRLRRKRDILLGLPHSEFLGIASTFSGLVLSLILGLTIYNNTHASSINITLTGNPELNLVKSNTEPVFGTTVANPQTATITSDHFTGYTLTIAGKDDIGSLKGANDNTKTIPSIQTAISENTFRNDTQYNDMWGFLPNKLRVSGTTINNSNYQPAPKLAGTTIDVTTSPTSSEGNKYNLALGAKITPTMALDSYSGTFVLAATGNGYDYHIGFTDDLETIPADIIGTNESSNKVTIPSTKPTKAGYIFKGWCTEPTTNDSTVCPGDTINAGTEITLDGTNGNNYDLHTIWEPVTFAKAFADASVSMTMQNMTTSICNAVAIGQEGTLTDTRDSKTYNVGKMKDGRCWMLDNLALGGTSATALSSSNTNIASNFTLPASTPITTGFYTYTEPRIDTSLSDSTTSDSLSQTHGWKAGVYYNYCAATGGSYCPAGDAAGTATTQDICPKGWRMPSGGLGGEYQSFIDAYGINNTTAVQEILHLPISGTRASQEYANIGNDGNYWAHGSYDANNANVFSINVNGAIYPQGLYYRWVGFKIRCIAK